MRRGVPFKEARCDVAEREVKKNNPVDPIYPSFLEVSHLIHS
jgi:hypothetical protein